MEFSKLKLEIYDLMGTLVPGVLFIALGSLTVAGNIAGLSWLERLTGTQLTVLLFAAFAAGQLVQEAGDWLIRVTKGPRFLKQGRDGFWNSAEAQNVRDKIKRESSVDVMSADAAYDYCLTVVRDEFPKRDTFMAISDLARSMWLLSWASTIPLLRFTSWLGWSWGHAKMMAEGLVAIGVLSYLAWRRMIRFRGLSDVTVFRVFLAVKAADGTASSGENGAESDSAVS